MSNPHYVKLEVSLDGLSRCDAHDDEEITIELVVSELRRLMDERFGFNFASDIEIEVIESAGGKQS